MKRCQLYGTLEGEGFALKSALLRPTIPFLARGFLRLSARGAKRGAYAPLILEFHTLRESLSPHRILPPYRILGLAPHYIPHSVRTLHQMDL